MNTYVIKYKNEAGHNLRKYIMAEDQMDAHAKFLERFGRHKRVYGCNILLTNQK